MELIEFATALGYRIVAAGKGKNNAFNRDAVPDDYREEATRRNMNPRMLVEFVDGSKTMVEMACIANATGLVPDVPGMHGPAADRDQMVKVLIPKADGGILNKKGVVDFTIGKGVAPGVFCIVEAEHPRIIERMDDLHVGHGPYYSFFRPYHLTSLEVPLTAARIMLYGKPDMVPLPIPVAEVCAVAKRDLAVGETFDAIGETCYRSFTLTAVDARAQQAVPVGLLEGGKVTAPGQEGRTADPHQRRPRRQPPASSPCARCRTEMLGYALDDWPPAIALPSGTASPRATTALRARSGSRLTPLFAPPGLALLVRIICQAPPATSARCRLRHRLADASSSLPAAHTRHRHRLRPRHDH